MNVEWARAVHAITAEVDDLDPTELALLLDLAHRADDDGVRRTSCRAIGDRIGAAAGDVAAAARMLERRGVLQVTEVAGFRTWSDGSRHRWSVGWDFQIVPPWGPSRVWDA